MSDIIKQTSELVGRIRALIQKRPSYHEVLKWDRNQPRNPAGSTGGGRWRKAVAGAVSQGLGSTPDEYTHVPGMTRRIGNASYADLMDAPQGTGFHNRPRGVGIPEPPPDSSTTGAGSPAVRHELETGVPTDSRPLGTSGNANASCVVTLANGVEAAYKPERGELWSRYGFNNADIGRLITNKSFSLAEREAFASQVDDTLALGLVPITVLRTEVDETHVDVEVGDPRGGSGGGGGGGSSYYSTGSPPAVSMDEQRRMYDSYKQGLLDNGAAYDEVANQMGQLYGEAQDEHVGDINSRAMEMAEIWNEEIKAFPDLSDYGSQSMLAQHPKLPMGSQQSFGRKDLLGELDPLEVLDEANVDPSSPLSDMEKERIAVIIRKRLAEGYQALGDVDDKAAHDHLDYDEWREQHEETENRLLSQQILSFSDWRQNQGLDSGRPGEWHSGNSGVSGGSGGGGGVDGRNPDAPHPRGGSFQHFVKGDQFGDLSTEDGAKLAVLDYVIGTMDRHGKNIMFDNDRAIAIDNGYSMPGVEMSSPPDAFTFRSQGVQTWLSDGGNIPDNIRIDIHQRLASTDWAAFLDRHPSMSAAERRAFMGRVSNMKDALGTEDGLRDLWNRQQLY